jgi:hypothetical protein
MGASTSFAEAGGAQVLSAQPIPKAKGAELLGLIVEEERQRQELLAYVILSSILYPTRPEH